MNTSEYVEGNSIAIENYKEYTKKFWKLNHIETNHLLLADNRKTFLKILGKPHFHYNSEFYFHCWCLEFKYCKLVILTAGTKGTCYEIIPIGNTHNIKDVLIYLEKLAKQIRKL